MRAAVVECTTLVERCRLLAHHLEELRLDGGQGLADRLMKAAAILEDTREELAELPG